MNKNECYKLRTERALTKTAGVFAVKFSDEDRERLKRIHAATGQTISDIIRRGIELAEKELKS